MKKLIFLLAVVLSLTACGNSGITLPSVNGGQYEILIVMNDSDWKAPAGRELVALFNQDMEALPQSEPVMTIIQCTRAEFTDFLKPSRNILIAEIDAKYSQPKITYSNNVWAQPQCFVKIQAGNLASMEGMVKTHGKKILNYFLESERDRIIKFNKEYVNTNIKLEIEKQFGILIDIPSELNKATKGKDFYWVTNDNPAGRKDIVIYSYPYTDKNMFTKEALLAKRDSVMKAGIPGEFEGSFMGTETKYATPVFNEIWVNKQYCAELKGLWRMYKGGSMGGPFYSHSRLDEVNQRIITVEGFVFAPGGKKRNHIRQLEAVIYSMTLPHEINAIDEVSVVADKK